jgi:hypothetical protein
MGRIKIIFPITFLIGAVLLFALQAEAQYFNKRIDYMGLNLYENGFSIEKMPNENFLLFFGAVDFDTQFGIGRLGISPQGEVISEIFNNDENVPLYAGNANTSTMLTDGSFISSGSRGWYFSALESLITLNKYHEDGTLEWIQFYGDSIHQSAGQSTAQLPNGNLAVVGWKQVPGPDLTKGFLIVTDEAGTLLTINEYGGSAVDALYSVYATFDGGTILGGYTRSFGTLGMKNHFLVKTDSLGNQEWMRAIGSTREDCAADVIQSSDGNFVFCGCWNEYTIADTEHYTFAYISKLNSSGDLIWEHTYEDLFEGSNYYTRLRIIKELENEDFIVIGERAGANVGIMLRTDKDGNLLWYREFLHPTTQSYGAYNIINDVIPDGEGGFVCAGWLYGSPLDSIQGQDLWVFRTDSMGCLVPGCHLTDNITVHANEVAVSLYPNPVQDQLSVHIKAGELPQGATIELYDMQGRQHLSTLLEPGARTYIIDMRHYASGVYLLHCLTPTEMLWTGKVVKN